MSCINVIITKVSPSPVLVVGNLGGIDLNVSRVDTPLAISVQDILKNQHLVVTCGVICGFINTDYLRVSPTVVWLTPDNLFSGDFDIESNVNWEIEL